MQLDGKLPQRAAELRLTAVIRPAFAGWLEDAVAVGVQRQRSTVLLQPAAQEVEVALHRLGGVEAGLDATRGVVDHGDQHHRLAASFQPVVDRRVHLHQFPKAIPPWPPLPMLLALPLPLPQARRQQPTPQRVVRHPQPLLRQLLAGQGRSEVRVALLVLSEHLLPQFGRQAPIRGPAAQAGG